jgi:hypothetical protein
MNFNPGGHPICIDSGASCSISNTKEHFTDFQSTNDGILHGISSGLSIAGKGTLRWSITVDNGDEVKLYIRDSLYVPSAPMCRLSPQQLLQQTNNARDNFTIHPSYGILHFHNHTKTILYNKNNNLPIFLTYQPPHPLFLPVSTKNTPHPILTHHNINSFCVTTN